MTAASRLGLPDGIRACLFDLDGVLTCTATVHAAAWKQVLDAFLHDRAASTGDTFRPFDLEADYRGYVDGRRRSDGARAFLAARGVAVTEDAVHALGAAKDALFLEAIHRDGVERYEESVAYVREVAAAGLRRGVVSASRHCAEVLRASGIEELFEVRVDGVVAERDGLAGKPAPDTFLAAARRLEVEPAEAVVFEDALAGVEAGRAGGFGYVVGVDRGDQAGSLQEHGADVVVADLGALLTAVGPGLRRRG
jgi:beta-phosphoglucomutase family hydrolase